jgi:hypothetical protein
MNDIQPHKNSPLEQEMFDCIIVLNASTLSVRYDIAKTKMNTSLGENEDLHAARIVNKGVFVIGSDTAKYTKARNSKPTSMNRYRGYSTKHVHLPLLYSYRPTGTTAPSIRVMSLLGGTKTNVPVKGSHSELFWGHGFVSNSTKEMIGSNKNDAYIRK